MKLIDKDALVAKIESRISDIKVSQRVGLIKKRDAEKKIALFKSILSLINTLKVKEVDLDLEITLWANAIPEIRLDDVERLAKHFFELGLRSTITEEDCKLIWNIGDEILNMPEEEFFKELLKRYKAQKGEKV